MGVGFLPERTYMDVNITVKPDIQIIENFKSNRYSNVKCSMKVIIKGLSNTKVSFKVYTNDKYTILYNTRFQWNGTFQNTCKT